MESTNSQEKIDLLTAQVDELSGDLNRIINENKQLKQQKQSASTGTIVLGILCAVMLILLIFGYVSGLPFSSQKEQMKKLQAQNIELAAVNQNQTQQIATLSADLNQLKADKSMFNPMGLVYRVQIGAFERFKLPVYSDELMGMAEADVKPYMKYSVGMFKTRAEVDKFLQGLKRLGFDDAFVIAQFDGKQITTKQAAEIQSKEGKK